MSLCRQTWAGSRGFAWPLDQTSNKPDVGYNAPTKQSLLQAAPEGSGRRFKLGKMAIRTRWFDDQIEAALGMPVAGEQEY